MKNQLRSEIKHITIVGKVNSGKSSIINKLTNKQTSIVSDIEGTTTDPVVKRMELLDVGAINIIDTAGLDDTTILGEQRKDKTLNRIKSSDLILIVSDITNIDEDFIQDTIKMAKEYKIDYLIVYNKIDLVESYDEKSDAIYISSLGDIEPLTTALTKKLIIKNEKTILGDLIKPLEKILLVIPIDSEAPKGRIILPQQNILRECLDKNIIAICCQVSEIKQVFEDVKGIKLVVTDSQAFKEVNELIPNDVALSSFSILFANYKGDIDTFVNGVHKIDRLTKESNVLMLESCTHNSTHEDIGQVKIPNLIEKHLGFRPNFIFRCSSDFSNLEDIDLIIHCGSCMLTEKTMQSRLIECEKQGIDITNYGVVLAYLNGILDKSIEVFSWK